MGYQYTDITLETVDETGANIRPVKTYLPASAGRTSISMCEKIRLTITFQSSTNFVANQNFCFNLRLFSSPTDVPSLASVGAGWLIQINSTTSGLVATATLPANANNRNYSVNSVTLTAADTMEIEYDFFVTSDLQDWAVKEFVANKNRLVRNSSGNEFLLNNSKPSAFNRVDSYIEICIFECNDQLEPYSLLTPAPFDPYVRDPNAMQNETFAINVSCKWYDENEGAVNKWVSNTDKADNFLKSILNNSGLLERLILVSHYGYDVYYRDTLRNFRFTNETTQMVVNLPTAATADKNNITMVIDTPNLTNFTKLICSLVRVDKQNNKLDFVDSQKLDQATIPKTQPVAGTINGGAFETPSAWSTAGGLTTIEFVINGEYLQPKGEYHLIATLYDSATDFSSSHISPPLTASSAPVFSPTITGIISTLKQDHTNVNDLSVTNFERVKLRIEVDASTYSSLAAFQGELKVVTLTSQLLPNNPTQSKFDFAAFAANGYVYDNSQSSGFPQIFAEDLGGGVYAFEATLRSYYAATVLLQSFHTWALRFTPGGWNQPPSVILEFEQRLKHRPDDAARLTAMRFLDYDDFQAGTLTEISRICTTTDRIVIETTKNAAPDADVVAQVLGSNPANALPSSANTFIVAEEENYIPNLPQLSAIVIEDVDPDFAAQLDPNKAYWTLVVDGFSQTGEYYAQTLIFNK